MNSNYVLLVGVELFLLHVLDDKERLVTSSSKPSLACRCFFSGMDSYGLMQQFMRCGGQA